MSRIRLELVYETLLITSILVLVVITNFDEKGT